MPWALVAGIAAVLTGFIVVALPVAIAIGLAVLGFYWWRNNPQRKEREYAELTLDMYHKARRERQHYTVQWTVPPPFVPIAKELIDQEIGDQRIPPPPAIANSIEGARYRDRLSKNLGLTEADVWEATRAIEEAIDPFVWIYNNSADLFDGDEETEIPIEYYLSNLKSAVENCIVPFYRNSERFIQLRRTLDRNLEAQSTPTKEVLPRDYKGDDIINAYLRGTPLKKLFQITVPFGLPEPIRSEHHFILGGTGSGKTQSMQYYIAKDIERVLNNEISIIVIDSQGDMIDKIRQLDGLTPENTIIIDPEDVEFPVCLNLFDIKTERLNSYTPLARERQLNGIIELYDYVLGALLSAEMTQKQQVVFRYVTRLLLLVPNATIHTMLDLFQDGAMERYEDYIDQLDPVAQTFFRTEFAGREFTQTRRQVVRRLYGILENQAFTRMFTNPKSKLDLFSEMNKGKLILINTSKSLLKEEGTEIFGRFFIAMITQAAQEREEIPERDRKPCYVYIDEANDYRFDEKIDLILTQARKYNVGLIIATQYLNKISPTLQAAIAANTSIKFASNVSHHDARRMAPDMRCTPEFIEAQPPLTFAAYVRGITSRAVPLRFTPGYLERLPKASEEAQAELLAANRAAYAEPVHLKEEAPPEEEAEAVAPEPEPEPQPEPANEPIKGNGFVMAESVPEEERMERPKKRRKPKPHLPKTSKTDPDNVDEVGEW